MIPLLAQTAASNDALGSWMTIGIYAVGGLVLLFQILAFFATRREMDAMEKRMDAHEEIHQQLFSKLGGQERGLRTESDSKVAELRLKIDELTKTVSAVEAAANIHTDQLEQVNRDIKDMPSQMIAQLSNLGVLKRPDRS